MAEKVLILGNPGTGKSTSLETLNPEATFIIQSVVKRLPFKGWKNKYKMISQENPNGNLSITHDYETIEKQLKYIDSKRPEIKTVIIDDANYLMTEDLMARVPKKTLKGEAFEKYNQIAYNFHHLLKAVEPLRNDLIVVFLAHTQINDDGSRSFKTVGKLLDNTIVIEGLATIVLESVIKENKYLFQTNKIDGTEPCKTPKGMFEEKFISNDMQLVIEKIEEYDI